MDEKHKAALMAIRRDAIASVAWTEVVTPRQAAQAQQELGIEPLADEIKKQWLPLRAQAILALVATLREEYEEVMK